MLAWLSMSTSPALTTPAPSRSCMPTTSKRACLLRGRTLACCVDACLSLRGGVLLLFLLMPMTSEQAGRGDVWVLGCPSTEEGACCSWLGTFQPRLPAQLFRYSLCPALCAPTPPAPQAPERYHSHHTRMGSTRQPLPLPPLCSCTAGACSGTAAATPGWGSSTWMSS